MNSPSYTPVISPIPWRHRRIHRGGNAPADVLDYRDEAAADRVARELVGSRLAACVNIFGTGRSVYRWDDEIVSSPEVFAWAKTTRSRLEELQARVTELHPFEVPCVVAYPAQGGLPAYLDWVATETWEQ